MASDLTAVQIAQFFVGNCGLNRNSAKPFPRLFARTHAEACELERRFRGTVEFDESFEPRRVKNKAHSGAGKNTFVFGICKRRGKVYTEAVEDCTKPTILPAIRGLVHFRWSSTSKDSRATTAWLHGPQETRTSRYSANEFSSRIISGNHINSHLDRHGLLELCQNTTGSVQRNEAKHILLAPQRMRVPLQPPLTKHVQSLAYAHPHAPAQLVMTLFE